MAFGKRISRPGNPTETAAAEAATGPEAPPSSLEERCEALRKTMLRLFEEAGRVAEAVRSNGIIALPGLDEEIDPRGPPLSLMGFHDHFSFTENGQAMHSVFVYADAPDLGALDPNAQFHLHVLTGRILELNRFCQQAVIDDALGVALQSPKLPALLDRIIVGTAFFASFFDGMSVARPHFSAKPMRALPAADVARLTDSMERHKLMAFDHMLAPHGLAEMLPSQRWPIVGVETLWPGHKGERYINGVYFPAEHARPIIAAQATWQSESDLAATGS
jgi:hypothetical protein